MLKINEDQDQAEIEEAEIDNDDCDANQSLLSKISVHIQDELKMLNKVNKLYCEMTSMFIFSLPFVQIAKRIDFNEVPITALDSDDQFNTINSKEDNAGLFLKNKMKEKIIELNNTSV